MPTLRRTLLVVTGIVVLSGWALAEKPTKKAAPPKPTPKKAPPPETKGGVLKLLGAGDVGEAAADLRKAGESFERFGKALETVTPTITKGLTESSQNLANIGGAFDPMGLKTAFTVIHEQNKIILALQQAEIERLKAECERLRKALGEKPAGTKKSKKKRK